MKTELKVKASKDLQSQIEKELKAAEPENGVAKAILDSNLTGETIENKENIKKLEKNE